MYLVQAENFQQSSSPTQPLPQTPPKKTHPSIKTKRVAFQNVKHSHDKWVALRTKLLEADIEETELIQRFAVSCAKYCYNPRPKRTGTSLSFRKFSKIEMIYGGDATAICYS